MDHAYETSGQFLEARGIEFHYALDGSSSNPTLALINMASANLTSWEPVLGLLLEDFQVLRFDLRGTGKSGWGREDEFTFSQYADDLAAILRELDLSKAFVLGVAYGARTAAQFALRHPGKLSALGLFDVALTPPVEQSGQRELGRKAVQMLSDVGESMPSRRKSWRFYENRQAAENAHTAHLHEPDTSEMLGHLTVPVLIGCGRQDMNLPEAERIAAGISCAEFHIMEMTGHGSPHFRPRLFSEIVIDFARDRLTDS